MIHSPAALWHERQRFLPAVLAVAFSALLIVLQAGLLLGFFSLKSVPIDRASADLWVSHPDVPSVDLGRPIPERWLERVAAQPEVARAEPYVLAPLTLNRADGRTETCLLIGSRLDGDALGPVRDLTPQLRRALTEPGTLVTDETITSGPGDDVAEVRGQRVRLVGRVPGLKGLGVAYLFCSLETARMLGVGLRPDEVNFVLARLRDPADAAAVAQRLQDRYEMAAFTREQFSADTRLYWLTKTQAGTATAWTALIGLVIGAVITGQILYAVTLSYRREYAVLRALGIPRWRLASSVLTQAFWVGCAGLVIATAGTVCMTRLAAALGITVLTPPWLLAAGGLITLAMAVLSSLTALRSLWRIEPVELLR